MVYLLPLLLLLFLIFIYDTHTSKIGSDVWYRFVFVVFVCIAGFRYKVGGDSLEYFYSFNTEIPILDYLRDRHFVQLRYEPFWILLNSICKTIVNDFAFFQFIHAIIVNLTLFRFFKKYTPYKFTAVLIYALFYYFYYNTEVMRESLAVSFFLLAYPSLQRRRWLSYYVLAFFATLFHSSGVFMFIVPFFRNTTFNQRTAIIMGISVIAAITLFNFAPNIIPNAELQRRFRGYQEFTPSLNGFLYYLTIYFIGPYLIYRNYLKRKPILFTELVSIYFVIAITVSYLTGFSRLINYFMPFLTVYFANYLFLLGELKRYRQVRPALIIVVFTLVFIPKYLYYFKDTSHLVAGTRNYERWYPYTNIFDMKEIDTRRLLFYRSFDYSREYIRDKNN